MDFFDKDKTNIIISITNTILLTVIIIITVITLLKVPTNKNYVEEDKSIIEEIVEPTDPIPEETILEETIVPEQITYKVDIKGAVKTPGVYIVDSNAIINDVINLAGGLKNNASTKYLNLSKKVTDEMVINIYTSYEISQMNTTPKDECATNSEVLTDCKNASTIVKKDNDTNSEEVKETLEQNKKVSINNGTKEELMTLSGIGEAKANAIIEYRNANGPFKTLEDITNVSGIGKEAFEKIKDNIEL